MQNDEALYLALWVCSTIGILIGLQVRLEDNLFQPDMKIN